MRDGALFSASVFLVTCLLLYVVLIGGHLGILVSDWMRLRALPANDQLCSFFQNVGITAGMTGMIFHVSSLMPVGILLLTLGVILSPHNVMPLRGLAGSFVYTAGGLCLILILIARL